MKEAFISTLIYTLTLQHSIEGQACCKLFAFVLKILVF